jgi:hypothetical protein
MIGLFETAQELQSFCDRRGWLSCFIGGIAVQRWGEPAQDIRDAEGIVLRNKQQLDWSYIEDQLRPLAEAKQEPGILDTLARLREL